jgi:hypothetical protein
LANPKRRIVPDSGHCRHVERSDAPTASVAAVDRSVAVAERTIGAAFSTEQRHAVAGICASDRGAELIVGVARAGKTTMLQVVAAAYEASGCHVMVAATSGPAARTLGREAEIGGVPHVGQPAVPARPRAAITEPCLGRLPVLVEL